MCANNNEKHSVTGTFSGGPNGIFKFKDGSLRLINGKYIEINGDTFKVQNPEAFKYWK